MNEPGTRVAIIDLGTNTFKLLVCERQEGRMRVLHRDELPVYLGRGGIEQGIIADEAFARGIATLRTLADRARELGASIPRAFGTSALRNARNAPEFASAALDATGITISIIPGEEEAGLILEGVRQAVRMGDRPALIMDIGGGSTEFIIATDKALLWKRSFELGVTRLRERIPVSDPMSMAEETRISAHLDERLAPLYAMIERYMPRILIGSAGSFDTLAAIIIGTTPPAEETSLAFTADAFDELKDRLLRMTRDERLRVQGLPEHRVDTIPYALVQIERVLQAGGIYELAWSRYALKEGAAARIMGIP